MKVFKTFLLSGAAAVAALSSIGSAYAADLNGGGATLVNLAWRQAANCFGGYVDLQVRNSLTTLQVSEFTPTTATAAILNCDNTALDGDAADTNGTQPALGVPHTINYVSTGSGRGIGGVFSNLSSTWNSYTGTQHASVQYGISEGAINNCNRLYYDTGALPSGCTYLGSGAPPVGGTKAKGGALVQLPILIATVTVAFDPVYKKVRLADGSIKEYKLNIKSAASRLPSGGLKLKQRTYCALFGAPFPGDLPIVNLNDARLTADNKVSGAGQSLKDPTDPATFDSPIKIVGRSETSGTTTLFTRHISAACGTPVSAGGSNPYNNANSTLPASLIGVSYNKTTANDPVAGEVEGNGLFTIADGNDGVAKYTDFTRVPGLTPGDTVKQARIAYLSPDWVLPASLDTSTNNFGLFTSDLENLAGKFVAPTADGALASFGAILPPQSTASGAYSATALAFGQRVNPEDWTQAPDRSAAIANPAAVKPNNTPNALAYPIAGTANMLLYTCYSDAAKRGALVDLLNYYNTSATIISPAKANPGVLARAGFSPMPDGWRTAIKQTFYSTVAATAGLNLYITKAVTATGKNQVNTSCAALPGGGVN